MQARLASTRTPRDEFTCNGLTPKPPRHWTTLADAVPALTVAQARDGESAAECAERLRLPHLDPRNWATPDDRHYARWMGRQGYTVGTITMGGDSPHGQPRDAYDDLRFRSKILCFLHALRCLAEGTSECLGFLFEPEMQPLFTEPQIIYHECPNSYHRVSWRDECHVCGADAEEDCIRTESKPRYGRNWWTRYEHSGAEGGPWHGGTHGLTDGHKGFSRLQKKIAERKLLQLRLLLARSVLNRGDTLAVRALVLHGVPWPRPSPTAALTSGFYGVIYFSHCFRCGLPWSNVACPHPDFDASRSRLDVREYDKLDLRHDHRSPGLPMHYHVCSMPIDLHFHGRRIHTSEFTNDSQFPHDQCVLSNQMAILEDRHLDPPSDRIVCDYMVIDDIVGHAASVTSLQQNDLLPVRSSEFRVERRSIGPLYDAGWTACEALPPVHVSNPGGTLDIFWASRFSEGYSSVRLPSGVISHGHSRQMNECERLVMGVELRPAVDCTEELLQWAEQQAAANGVALPYQQEGFTAASVAPVSVLEQTGQDSEMGL